jgi:hypothetical protein
MLTSINAFQDSTWHWQLHEDWQHENYIFSSFLQYASAYCISLKTFCLFCSLTNVVLFLNVTWSCPASLFLCSAYFMFFPLNEIICNSFLFLGRGDFYIQYVHPELGTTSIVRWKVCYPSIDYVLDQHKFFLFPNVSFLEECIFFNIKNIGSSGSISKNKINRWTLTVDFYFNAFNVLSF